jgi:hypothetical protein
MKQGTWIDTITWIDMSDPETGGKLKKICGDVLTFLGERTGSPQEGLAVLAMCQRFIQKEYRIQVEIHEMKTERPQ